MGMSTGVPDMDEKTKQLNEVLAQILDQRAIKTIRKGAVKALDVLWLIIGRVDAYFILGFLFVFQALIQLMIQAQYPDIKSGLDALTTHPQQQMLIIFFMAGMGLLISYTRNDTLLTFGALFWVVYVAGVTQATFAGEIDPRGYLSATSNLSMLFAVVRSTYAQRELGAMKLKYQRLLSEAQAVKHVVSNGRDTQISA